MKYLKTLMYECIIFICLTLVTSILYYFNIISDSLNYIFKIVIFIITFLFSGLYIAKKSKKKYYLEGLKISLINIFIFLIFSLLFKYGFNLNQILYYLLIILITTFGSIIGGNIKKDK